MSSKKHKSGCSRKVRKTTVINGRLVTRVLGPMALIEEGKRIQASIEADQAAWAERAARARADAQARRKAAVVKRKQVQEPEAGKQADETVVTTEIGTGSVYGASS